MSPITSCLSSCFSVAYNEGSVVHFMILRWQQFLVGPARAKQPKPPLCFTLDIRLSISNAILQSACSNRIKGVLLENYFPNSGLAIFFFFFYQVYREGETEKNKTLSLPSHLHPKKKVH